MKYLYRTLSALYVDGFYSVLRVKAENGSLYVTLEYMLSTDPEGFRDMSVSAVYNGVTKALVNAGDNMKSATFTYADDVKTVSFTNAAIRYLDDASVRSFTWKGGINDPDPEVTLEVDGIRVQKATTLSCTLANDSTGLILRGIELYDYRRSSPSDAWTRGAIADSSGFWPTTLRLSNNGRYPAGWEAQFEMLYGFFRTMNDGHEEYVGLAEAVSEIYVGTAQGTPYPPRHLAVRRATAGSTASVVWDAVEDPDFTVTAYELQRSVNGESYTLRYADRSTAFNDPIDLDTRTVRYRVRSVAGSAKSAWAAMPEDFEPSHSNLFLKTPDGLKAVSGLYVGIGRRPVRAGSAMQVGRN